MTQRWQPTIGLVGVDFGFKPAISLAVPPVRRLIKQFPDDEPAAASCHDLLGDTLQVAISGILTCSGCYTFGSAPAQDVHLTFTGLNGVFTATWDAITLAWEVVIGTVTETIYSSSDGSCAGETGTTTGDVQLSLLCSGDNLFTATAVGGGAISVGVFSGGVSTPVPFGDPITNDFTPPDCGANTGGYGGTITLSV